MADKANTAPNQYQVGHALRDLSWFYGVFALLVAGPSVLSILQAVFVEHRLVASLQWIVDGYNDILAVLGAAFEPLVQPAINWINARFNLALDLQPHWKPLFVLVTMLTGTVARFSLSAKGGSGLIVSTLLGTLGTLLGALAAGLAPLSGGWWVQGFAASAPVAGLFLGAALYGVLLRVFSAKARESVANATEQQRNSQRSALRIVFALPIWIFAIAAALSFAPGIQHGAGILTLAGAILVLGLLVTAIGLFLAVVEKRNPTTGAPDITRGILRFGLTLLGGFLLAGLILAADAALRAWAPN